VKLIIAGSRTFTNYDFLEETILINFDIEDLEIVCGEARGADLLGREFAEDYNLKIHSYPANWEKHGKSAGHIRNAAMGKEADFLLAFWDGKSKGTQGMINYMKKNNKGYQVVTNWSNDGTS
jgi:hypothetical protein